MKNLCAHIEYNDKLLPPKGVYYGIALRYLPLDIDETIVETMDIDKSPDQTPTITKMPTISLQLSREKVQDDQWIDKTKVDNAILNSIYKHADKKVFTPSGNPNLATLTAHFLRIANTIRTATRRSAANVMYINHAMFKVLNEMDFKTNDINTNKEIIIRGLDNIAVFNKDIENGSWLLNGCIQVKVKEFGNEIPSAILAYIGDTKYDGGISLVIDETNNRYAVVDNIPDTDKYYYIVELMA